MRRLLARLRPRRPRRPLRVLLTVALSRAVATLLRREPPRQVCPECAVDFRPALTDARCPICGWLAVDPARAPRPRPVAGRAVAGLGAAWFVGVVVFALVAHALYA